MENAEDRHHEGISSSPLQASLNTVWSCLPGLAPRCLHMYYVRSTYMYVLLLLLLLYVCMYVCSASLAALVIDPFFYEE